MIVIYYYEFKADPEHIRVIGWKNKRSANEQEVCWLEPSMLLLFLIHLSGKGYINILRMRKGNTGNGDDDDVCVYVCVVIHNAKSRPFSYFTRFLNALNFFCPFYLLNTKSALPQCPKSSFALGSSRVCIFNQNLCGSTEYIRVHDQPFSAPTAATSHKDLPVSHKAHPFCPTAV